ncbi:uncharacterized protein LOC117175542 [Belonocnema kinseyi]|uniref:uncharacterized protein LOC117175542 n=1 Tax=Belonocnema kinseyi TaxID=2817044 RepID=UPI00143CED78|nr:uncharacterized protein LOC117175542 [Belonocnema kinseyi]
MIIISNQQAHLRSLHGGPQLTLHILRQNFWMLKARNSVRHIINQCITCVRQRAKIPSQMMGYLPTARVTRSRQFEHSGLDYAGPLLVRLGIGHGYKSHKAYIALFICLATRAIYLELVSDCSTFSFLAAFKRFVSRRGLPSNLHSNNGTNFQAASKELKIAFRKLRADENVRNFFVTESITWHFIPPYAPHFGGLWEAALKSVKHHLRRIVGNHTLTIEDMSTLLCQIEASLQAFFLQDPLCSRYQNHQSLI